MNDEILGKERQLRKTNSSWVPQISMTCNPWTIVVFVSYGSSFVDVTREPRLDRAGAKCNRAWLRSNGALAEASFNMSSEKFHGV